MQHALCIHGKRNGTFACFIELRLAIIIESFVFSSFTACTKPFGLSERSGHMIVFYQSNFIFFYWIEICKKNPQLSIISNIYIYIQNAIENIWKRITQEYPGFFCIL